MGLADPLQHIVAMRHPKIGVITQEWIRESHGCCKHLLRKRVIGADSKELDIELFKFAVVDHPGLEIGRSCGVKIQGVELEEHMLFVFELA